MAPRWPGTRRRAWTRDVAADVTAAVLAVVVTAAAVVAFAGGCGPRGAARAPAHVGRGAGARLEREGGERMAAGPDAPGRPPLTGPPVRLTMYHVAVQSCPDPPQVGLEACGGGVIAKVSSTFRKKLAMQGTARLCDGRVVGVRKVSPLCFAVVEGSAWGMTASGRPASPFRSIAVDPKQFKLGRWYWVPELVGLELPPPAAGKRHDGCVHADDVGGAVKGDHVDFFVGSHEAMAALAAKLDHATVHLAEDDGRCEGAGAW